jgi:hypothetical protein
MTTRALSVPFALAQLSTENPATPRKMLGSFGRINSLKGSRFAARRSNRVLPRRLDVARQGDNNKETRHG